MHHRSTVRDLDLPEAKVRVTKFESDDLSGARFLGVNLAGAEFREVVLDGSRMLGVVMQGVEIDGLVGNLTVNGVEVTAYVEGELDRRHPERPLLRSDDPAELLAGWEMVQEQWAVTIERLEEGGEAVQHASVDEEWSAVETLRHLVHVTDSWVLDTALGRPRPYHPLGLAPSFVKDSEVLGLDPRAAPSLPEVLAVRAARVAVVRDLLANATRESLHSPAANSLGEDRTVLDCLHVVLDEEWAHHRFCVRDLNRLAADRG